MPFPPQHAAQISEERKRPHYKIFDDDEWIRSLTEAQELTADIQERIIYDEEGVDPQKVRPIQMVKYVARSLMALSEGEITALTTAMRQLGVGSQGGAEDLAIFHQFLFDECTSGTLVTPLAGIKVDEQMFWND